MVTLSARDAGKRSIAFIKLAAELVRPDRRLLAFAVSIAVISAALQTLLLFCMATIAIEISEPTVQATAAMRLFGSARMSIAQLCGVTLALTLAVLALTYPLAAIEAQLGSRAVGRARSQLVRGFLSASRAYRLTHREGYFQQLVGEYSQHLSLLVTHLATLLVASATMLVLLIMPALLHPALAIAELVGLTGSLLVLAIWLRLARRDSTIISRALTDLASTVAEAVRVADDVEAFRVGESVEQRLGDRIAAAGAAQRRITFHDFFVPNAYQFGTLALLIGAIGVIELFAPGSHPSLAVLALLTIRLIGYGRQALSAVQQGTSLLPHAVAVENEMRALSLNCAQRGQQAVQRFDGLTFDQVDFAYPSGDTVLSGVTLAIAPGEAVGIAGPSGGGKSSLCMLAMGLQRPTRGIVRVGDIDIAELAPQGWRGIAAYVPQDCRLVLGSVAHNIRFFRNTLSDDDIVEAAKAAQLHDEIMAMPQGYDTLIGPSSRELSGGQRQRLVIARALAERPGLLVLDEPSSALDAHSEALIAEALRALKGSTALLVIAHRPTTLVFCDRIFAMEFGRLSLVEDRRLPNAG